MSNKEPDNEKGWILNGLYFNPNDKRMIVPRRRGSGITVNFGSIGGMIVGILILAAIIAIIVTKHGG